MSRDGMKLYVLDHGNLFVDKGLIVGSRPLDTLNDPAYPAELVAYPVYTVLIDHPEGKVLFDTACNPHGMQRHWPGSLKRSFPYHAEESDYLPNRLEQLGIGTDEIDYVVVSHLHFDHAGCLEMFRRSRIIVHEVELSEVREEHRQGKHSAGYVREEIENLLRADLQWQTVGASTGRIPLLDGIDILNYGAGHAWGMLGLHVHMPASGSIVLASDAVYMKQSYELPIRLPSAVCDPEGYARTVESIRAHEKEHGAQVWFGHDPDQFRSLVKSTEGCYE